MNIKQLTNYKIMMKKIFTLLALFAGVLSASATDQVTVKTVDMAPGAKATVNIELASEVAYSGYSFSLTLPDGLSAVTETRNLPTETNATPTAQEVVKVAFTDRQAADNFYVFTKVSGQKVNFVVLPKPEAIKAIPAGTGIIMGVFVEAPTTAVPAGEIKISKTGSVDNIVFTDGKADANMAAVSSLAFDTYRLGDTTKSGGVDVNDYLDVAGLILSAQYSAVGDVTQDGVVNVNDYLGVASIILTGSVSAPALEIENEIEPE